MLQFISLGPSRLTVTPDFVGGQIIDDGSEERVRCGRLKSISRCLAGGCARWR